MDNFFFIKINIIIETSVKVIDKKKTKINIIIETSVTVIYKKYYNKYNNWNQRYSYR